MYEVYVLTFGEMLLTSLLFLLVLVVCVQLASSAINLCLDDVDEYEIIKDKLTIGCTVYDIVSGEIGTYLGEDLDSNNDIYSIVATVRDDNSIYCYHTVPDSLLHIIKIEQE